MSIEKRMLILIILIWHCVFILSLFNYGKFTPQTFTTGVAKIYYTMKKLTSKLQRTAVSIGFINNVIHNKVIPKFTEVKEHFINNNDKHDSEMKIL